MYKLDEFDTSTGQICIMSCISDIFNFYGLNVNESIVFCLAEAGLFYYKPIDLESVLSEHKEMTLFDLVMGGMKYNIPLMIKNIIQHFEFTIETSSNTEERVVQEFIEKHIQNGQPVLSLLSREFLGYLMPKYKNRISHSINIIGYDWKNNQVYASDSYIPTSPTTAYNGALSFNEYLQCLQTSEDIFMQDFGFRNIAFEKHLSCTFDDLSYDAALSSLKHMAAEFFDSNLLQGNIYTGMKAYQQFYEDYDKWTKIDNKVVFSQVMRYVHSRLTNFGGPVVTYSLFHEYIRNLLIKKQDLSLCKMCSICNDLEKKWFVIANLFGKASFYANDNTMKSLRERVRTVITDMNQMYHMILDI